MKLLSFARAERDGKTLIKYVTAEWEEGHVVRGTAQGKSQKCVRSRDGVEGKLSKAFEEAVEGEKKKRRNKSNHLYVLHIIYSLLFNLCSVWCLPFGWNNSGFLGWRGILISIRIIPGFQGADTELRQDYGAAGRMVLPFPQHHTESQNQWEWNWAWICLWSSSQPSFCAQTPMADADIVPECPLMSQGASPSPEVRYRAVPTRQKVTLHCLGWT